jgi:hypothetical protein
MIVLINFKKLSGDNAFRLAKELDQLDRGFRKTFDVALGLQQKDARCISPEITLPIFVLDVNAVPDNTDQPLLFERRKNGGNIRGVILNHPQYKISHDQLAEKMTRCTDLGWEVMVCATGMEEAMIINNRFRPQFLAVENKELIGKDISLSQYCPEIVTDTLANIDNNILFGGGIKSVEDIKFVKDQGGSGVLISSLVLNAEKPLEVLGDLLNPIHY